MVLRKIRHCLGKDNGAWDFRVPEKSCGWMRAQRSTERHGVQHRAYPAYGAASGALRSELCLSGDAVLWGSPACAGSSGSPSASSSTARGRAA